MKVTGKAPMHDAAAHGVNSSTLPVAMLLWGLVAGLVVMSL